ncbi:Paired box protein Pax-6 [Paramyrothecium foliicola]|nr:Paired box protein Pax-6 [Paramyrothecium foliicola]
MESFTQSQWPAWAYSGLDPFSGYNQAQPYPTYLADSMEAAYQSHQQHLVHHHQMSRTTESKPRLSKEEVEILEAEFQKNHKPNSSTKKALAESMRVDNARINNWFQNRRAREKKENNIRAYEARQRMEKEKMDASSGNDSGEEVHRDSVASSAPFPELRKPLRLANASSEPSPDNSNSDTYSESGRGTIDEHDTIASQISASCTHTDDLGASDSDCLSPKLEEHSSNSGSHIGAYLANTSPVQASDVALQAFESLEHLQTKCPEYLLDSYQPLIGSDAEELASSFSSQTFPSEQTFLEGSLLQENPHVQGPHEQDHDFSDSEISPAMHLKTPPAIDIASRRNRRPPPLAIAGARSYSYNIPKTAVDLSKRGQYGNTMRRVASVNGMVRIAKPSSGTPRSPFSERKAEGLLQLNRPPNINATKGSIAPPTPNTPVVSQHLSVDEALAAGTFSLDDKSPFSSMVVQDPTLRTPPTTPGIMDQLFSLNAAYESSMPDEPLATPGLGRFPGEFELPDMSTAVPSYLAQDCTSQPETPLYAPHMGPTYFGYAGGNAEYNWSEVSSSAKSSPGQNSQRVQFMNMTASNFS